MSVNQRGFAWIDEEIEHSDQDEARATALARKWSELHSAEEQRSFLRMAEDEEYGGRELDTCEDCEACHAGDYRQCEQVIEANKKIAAQQAERDLEIELVEDKLEAIGARMMRPYEHWNEDERYMEYMECGRFGEAA